ncbi:hypothetical protein PBRA_000007 [Plasmodiophora brassicae]|uniref:Uncharacterized protein n=1 Tax=Plasmodiophora brassicae TaxID=37360 RepID=A0A0G4IGM8_PLABS|nr:hypothetical protein PBRA_000007 [Plasmodiophora brassicae]
MPSHPLDSPRNQTVGGRSRRIARGVIAPAMARYKTAGSEVKVEDDIENMSVVQIAVAIEEENRQRLLREYRRLRAENEAAATSSSSAPSARQGSRVRLSTARTPPRFDGKADTFLAWARRAALYLRQQRLAEAVGIDKDGNPLKQVPDSVTEEQDVDARSVLELDMVSESAATAAGFSSCQSAAECWRALLAAFNPSSYAPIISALTGILDIRQEPSEKAMAFVNRAREAVRRFRSVCPVSVGDLSETLIAIIVALRVRPEFADVAHTIHNRSVDEPVTVDQIRSLLVQEEARLETVEYKAELAARSLTTTQRNTTRQTPIKQDGKVYIEVDPLKTCLVHPFKAGHKDAECNRHKQLTPNTEHGSEYERNAVLRAMASIHPSTPLTPDCWTAPAWPQ